MVVVVVVPVVEPLAVPMPQADEMAPTPRPVTPSMPSARRDGWDFLKPVSRLKLPPVEEAKPKPPTSDANRNASNFP